jgi:hypothetical protein
MENEHACSAKTAQSFAYIFWGLKYLTRYVEMHAVYDRI